MKNWINQISIFLMIFIFAASLSTAFPVLGIDDLLPSQEKHEASGVELNIGNSPKIQSLLKQEAEAVQSGLIPVIVQFENELTSSELSQLGAFTDSFDHTYSIIPAAAFSIDASDLEDVAALSFVTSIEFDAPTSIVLAQSTTQIGASRVWISHEVEGEGITVAVLDTGIDNDHSDLQNVVGEQDFTGEGTDDDHGHGTHVASTVAGSGTASGGVNKGVAPKANLLDVKVLGRAGQGSLSDTIAGIEWAVLNGADVISMSLGAQIPCNGLDATSLASDAAVKRGVHVVVAAGNAGPLPGTIGSPGCAREVITVGAVDRLDNVAAFSSRGPTLDGISKPDIVAPGVLILAARAGGGYTALSGTSMATPHVSGALALILSEKNGLSPEQLKDVVMNTAKDLGEHPNTQGAGRIQTYEAFIEATGLEPQDPPEEKDREQDPSDSDDEIEGEKQQEREEEIEEAERTSKENGHVDDVERVDEREKSGTHYYVVKGTKNDQPSKTVYVWINQDNGNVERVETFGLLGKIWNTIVRFFEYAGSLFT